MLFIEHVVNNKRVADHFLCRVIPPDHKLIASSMVLKTIYGELCFTILDTFCVLEISWKRDCRKELSVKNKQIAKTTTLKCLRQAAFLERGGGGNN